MRKSLPEQDNQCKGVTAKGIALFRHGYVSSAAFQKKDEENTWALLPSTPYDHAVRVCKVCYDAATIETFVTELTASTSATSGDEDASEDDTQKLLDVLPRLAVFNECDAVLHRACTMHADMVEKAKQRYVDTQQQSAGAASAAGGKASSELEDRVAQAMTRHLQAYSAHATTMCAQVQAMGTAVKEAMSQIITRLKALEDKLSQTSRTAASK